MHSLTSAIDAGLRAVIGVARVTRDAICVHSAVPLRLFLLSKRTSREYPGIFHFPFGSVRYVDVTALRSQYTEIFVEHSYDVTGIGDAPRIIDCGGNIGLSTIWFKHRYPQAIITVFEADPALADILEANVRNLRLTQIEFIRAAVGTKSGTVTFQQYGPMSGFVSDGDGVMVKSVRLADHITESIDILKVDIEGSEFNLLHDLCASGRITLVNNIICEVHGRAVDQEQIAKLWADLTGVGFRLTINWASIARGMPGPVDWTPFSAAGSGKFLFHLYGWRS